MRVPGERVFTQLRAVTLKLAYPSGALSGRVIARLRHTSRRSTQIQA